MKSQRLREKYSLVEKIDGVDLDKLVEKATIVHVLGLIYKGWISAKNKTSLADNIEAALGCLPTNSASSRSLQTC